MQLSSTQKGWLARVGFLAIALLFCNVYYADLIDRLPFGIHDWAQADRLSVAINYYDHGMNFFLPATHNLYSKGGVVGVEFPIQAYVAAAFGHIWGRESISICFRVLDILIAVSGLYALFLIVFTRTRDFIFSLFTPLFFFCSPVYVYYSGNFMPDAASVSICFIGFYFFFRYLDDGRLKSLFTCMLILTLAALIKTSSVTYLGGIGLFAIWQSISKKLWKQLGQIVLFGALMLAMILSNLAYVRYLNEHYESNLFLAKTNPFKSWEDFTFFLDHGFKQRWMSEYLLLQQYVIYMFTVTVGLAVSFRKKENLKLLIPMVFFLVMACVLTYLFGGQLSAHDYYILALFFPLLAFLLVYATLSIRQSLSGQALMPLRAGIFSAMLFTFFFADHQIYQRQFLIDHYHEDDYSYVWLQDSRQILDSLKVPEDKPIIIADYAPNMGLIYANRRGYNLAKDWVLIDMNNVRAAVKDRHTDILLANSGIIKHMFEMDSTQKRDFVILSDKNNLMVLKHINP